MNHSLNHIFDEAKNQSTLRTPISGAVMPAYRARLENWHRHSGVRNGLPSMGGASCNAGGGGGGLPFSPDLVPLAAHRLVQERDGTAYAILAQHKYRFATFTEHLELEQVIPSCVALRLSDTQFAVPKALARDAGRVAIDETCHAECAGDLTDDLQKAIGVAPARRRRPAFLEVLRITKASLSPAQQRLADMAFTCVSETLITGSLLKVPHEERVIARVREVLGEHAREEAFHHGIFSQVIGVMWSQLGPAERDAVGPLFALFIAAFLRPDTLAELDALEATGFTADEAKRILEETREDGAEEARRTLWRAASPTIRAMRQHGLLGHAATVETLEMLELLPPTGTGTEGMPLET